MSTNGNGRSPGLLNSNRSNQQLNRRSLLGGDNGTPELRPRRSEDLLHDIAPVGSSERLAFGPKPSALKFDFIQLNKTASHYDKCPEEAQKWLIGFGNLIPKSNVSEDLRVPRAEVSDRAEESGIRTTYTSLLPSLTRWLRIWFDDALAARKKAQKNTGSRIQTLKEQGHLHWLCHYIRDYLGLDHAGLEPSDVESLSLHLFEICTATSEVGDIEDAVDILYALLLKWPFPRTILQQTLQIFSRVRLYFGRHSTPVHLADCVEILAKGSMREDVMELLCKFAAPSSISGDGGLTQVRIARGSILVLRGLIDTVSEDGSFVLEYTKVMPFLLESALIRNLRLCVDILELCGDLVEGGSRLLDTSSHDWTTFLQVVMACADPKFPGEIITARPHSSAHTASHGKPGDSANDSLKSQLHKDTVHRLNETFANLLHRLPLGNAFLLYEYLIAFPENVTESQCMVALQYAHERGVLRSNRMKYNLHSDALMAIVVRDQAFSVATRGLAVEVMTNAVNQDTEASIDEIGLDSSSRSKPERTKVLTFLFDRVLVEKEPEVLQTLLSALYMIGDSAEHEFQIVTQLKQLVATDKTRDELAEARTDVAARGLITTFLRTLVSKPKVVVSAFEAVVMVASLDCCSSEARLAAMGLMFRLRCDSEGFLYIQRELDSEYLAAALCRTRDSFEEFESGNTAPQRGSATSSSLGTSGSTLPRWMYSDIEPLPAVTKDSQSKLIARGHPSSEKTDSEQLDIGLWLLCAIQCLQNDPDWETYSFVVVHLGAQLSNTDLFAGCLSTVVKLRQVLSDQISKGSILEPPPHSGLRKHDVAICIFNILTPLISFATIKSEHIQKQFGDDLVRCFLAGVAQTYEGTSRGCIHALSICCLELPASVASSYPAIVERMSKNMTQSHLTLHILEFLAQVARLPQVHSKFREDEITMIFSICIQFLEKARDQHPPSAASPTPRLGTPSGRPTSGVNFRRPPYRVAMTQDVGLPQYASALAYHTMIFWFLSLKLEIRAKYVSWIVPRLIWKNSRGEEVLDEQSQVFVDMMQRAAFSDLGETLHHPDFAKESDGAVASSSWIVGMSVVTVETAGHSGVTQITKRQASGTTYAMYRQFTAELPAHHAPSNTEILPESADALPTEMLPSHILLQMVATAAPTSIADQPVPLPREDFVSRALSSFDHIPTVDSHKIGVLYIAPSQTTESEYLANTTASPDYHKFLGSLGYQVSLKLPLRFNPMGLQYPRDGQTTVAWRDRVTEIIYHVPTLMPTNLEDDPQCVAKKAHVGNDHVNIIFNNSGLPWKFENFKSQLNYVNIVITPATRPSSRDENAAGFGIPSSSASGPAFYKVHALTKTAFPSLSPAADPKIISAAQLPQFVRLIALNANVYSQAWNARDGGDAEFPSNWRARFQEIKRLRERVLAKLYGGVGTAASVGGTGSPALSASLTTAVNQGRRTPVPTTVAGGRDRDRDATEQIPDALLADRLDFSKWTL